MVDMKKYKIWVQMEYKRAAVMLPSILKRAVLLVAVCVLTAGAAFFCAGILRDQGSGEQKMRVGYTTEENRITALAVAFVQSMESVRSLCSLEAVTEQEGKQLLQEGELSALIVLPEDIINEILSGRNTPAVLYLPSRYGGGFRAAGDMLFEELAAAGIGMLGTAQAEIYACDAILQELSAVYGSAVFEDGLLQPMYDDINRFNLQAVAGREKLFRKKTLSPTENDTYAVYYGSALFTVYVLLAGLFFGKYCKRSGLQQTMADRRVGVGSTAQLAARCLAGAALMAVVLLLPFLTLAALELFLQMNSVLAVEASWQGLACLFFVVGFMTIYFMAIYQLVEKRESALVVIGLSALLQSYLSGCLIPSALLPGAVVSAGKLLPAAMVKKGFTILFTGDGQSFSYVAAGLSVWGLGLFCCTVLSIRAGERDKSAQSTGQRSSKIQVPSLGMVMFRRLAHRKSMWISLGAVVVLSAVVMRVEQGSNTQIRAAVYDASGDFAGALQACDGLVSFEQYGSEEAVQRAVLKGEAECGYVLPPSLASDMADMRADGAILVYQAADAVAVPVVNEILFERVFEQVSLRWFEAYIAQNSVIKNLGIDSGQVRETARECFDRQLRSDTTFRFEIRRLDMENAAADDRDGDYAAEDKSRTVYPVYMAAVFAVVLCALQGVLQVITDLREQHFYKRNRFSTSVLTFVLPLFLGVVCAFLVVMDSGG